MYFRYSVGNLIPSLGNKNKLSPITLVAGINLFLPQVMGIHLFMAPSDGNKFILITQWQEKIYSHQSVTGINLFASAIGMNKIILANY